MKRRNWTKLTWIAALALMLLGCDQPSSTSDGSESDDDQPAAEEEAQNDEASPRGSETPAEIPERSNGVEPNDEGPVPEEVQVGDNAADHHHGSGEGHHHAAGEEQAHPAITREVPPTPEDVAAAPEDAERSESGLAWRVLRAGTGTSHPGAEDVVTAEYSGWTTDGEMFDSSLRRDGPLDFPLENVIAGWTEGLQLMVVGEQRRFWIPSELAYGDAGRGPQGLLVFDVELVSFRDLPATPDNLAEAPALAQQTESGMSWMVLTPGTGSENPDENSIVTAHFTIWTSAGERLHTTHEAGEPETVPLGRIMPAMGEAMGLMTTGETSRFWVPQALTGEGRRQAPSDLVIELELISFQVAPEPPAVPDNVAAAPADAEVSDSGLASIVLRAGTGTTNPTSRSQVEVHYTGWTADGEMFDSSVTSGNPVTFGLRQVIPGWTEGLQLMVEGEQRRFWIPGDLAYEGRSGPQGTLVFDVELLRIDP